MPIFKDATFPLMDGEDPMRHRDAQIAWLHRRVENLEAMIFELLQGKADNDFVDAYRETVRNPGFNASSSMLIGRGEQIAASVRRGRPPK